MYVNQIENRITFRIKTIHHLKLLTPETMKLLGSTKSKITIDKNGEIVICLEIVEVVLVNIDCQINPRDLCTFVLNKLFGQLLDKLPKKFYIFKNF